MGRIRKRVKTDNIEKGRGIAGIVDDTERGLDSFGKEDTKQPYQQLDGRLSGRLAKSRGRGKRGKR